METNIVMLCGEQWGELCNVGLALCVLLGALFGFLVVAFGLRGSCFVLALLLGLMGVSHGVTNGETCVVHGCSNYFYSAQGWWMYGERQNGTYTYSSADEAWLISGWHLQTNNYSIIKLGSAGWQCPGWNYYPQTNNPGMATNRVVEGGWWNPAYSGMWIEGGGGSFPVQWSPVDCRTEPVPETYAKWPGYWELWNGICIWVSFCNLSGAHPHYDWGPVGHWVFDAEEEGAMPWDVHGPEGLIPRWRWEGAAWDNSLMNEGPWPWSDGPLPGPGDFQPDLGSNQPPPIYTPPGGVSNEPPLVITNMTLLLITNGWSDSAVKQLLSDVEHIYLEQLRGNTNMRSGLTAIDNSVRSLGSYLSNSLSGSGWTGGAAFASGTFGTNGDWGDGTGAVVDADGLFQSTSNGLVALRESGLESLWHLVQFPTIGSNPEWVLPLPDIEGAWEGESITLDLEADYWSGCWSLLRSIELFFLNLFCVCWAVQCVRRAIA